MGEGEARSIVREYLQKVLRREQLGDCDDVFAVGGVSSLFAMQLILYLEGKFDIVVENEDLEMQNFRTIDAIAAFVARKRSLQVAAQ